MAEGLEAIGSRRHFDYIVVGCGGVGRGLSTGCPGKLQGFLGPEMYTKVCLYTMTPDRNFVIDNCAHQGFSDVIVCCGAGHAYKFASVLGKILSEMAVDGRTQYNISDFTMDKPAITDPDFKPSFFMGHDNLVMPAAQI